MEPVRYSYSAAASPRPAESRGQNRASGAFVPRDSGGISGKGAFPAANAEKDAAPAARDEKDGGTNATAGKEQDGGGKAGKSGRRNQFDRNECQTCKRRQYQDASNDPGVSFKTPRRVAPQAAAAAVRGHEMEHVWREQAKAMREGREVVSQSVVLHTGVCPECGGVYISGGTTRTVTRKKSEVDEVLYYDALREQSAGTAQTA